MKLSVAAYRASVSNVNRHIAHPGRQQHQRQHTATSVTMSRSVSWGSNHQVDVAGSLGPFPSSSTTMVDGSNSGPNSAPPSIDLAPTVTFAPTAPEVEKCQQTEDEERRALLDPKPVSTPRPHRSRGNQRWMKLRTTVQLSGAVASAVKDKKPPLKREDSFLKRFSTRQIAEAQDTVDGDGNCNGDGGGESARRRRRRRREGPLSVINPDENFYFIWLTVLTVCVLYNCWTLIVRQAFPELQTGFSALWYAGDAFSDFIFLCDILFQFRTGYLEQGLMVYDSRKLAKHYMKSRAFGLDLASMLPLDLIQLFLGVNPIVRFPRFLKVYRSYNYYYMVESRTLYPNLWRVVNLIHVLLLLAHWFGCFYFLLSEAEGFRGHWVYPTPKEDFATLTRKYLGSLYWSTLTLTTIGDLPTPETDWEYLFTIVSYLIGVFIFATIVGQVGNVITNRNASRLEFERLLDGAKLYMRQHKVPRDMQRRVQRWYDYSWSRGRMQGGGDINSALGILPDKLKTELALHVNLNTLKKVSIFQECQPEFLHDLVLKMKAYIFTPGDLICRKGEVAREMFIIADGILEVISEIGKVLTTMRAGDFFGEIGILNLDGLNKRTADVRSVGYSELFSLSREDVLTAMKDYPEAQDILQSLGRKRLMEAKMAAAGIKKDTDSDSRKGSSSGGKDSTGDGESAINRAVQMVRRLKRDASGIRDFIFRRKGRPRKQVKIEMEPMPQSPEEDTIDTDVECEEMRLSDTTFGRRFPWNRRLTDEEKQAKKMRLIRAKSTRGILTRMQRVNSQSEPPSESPPTPLRITSEIEMAVTSEAPLGAGLPLLHRLHLLKEKQTRESLQQQQPQQQPLHSLQSSHVPTAPPPDQPLGAGLPLLKRLKLLREKEEREQKERGESGEKMAAVSPMVLTPCAPEAMGSGLPMFHRLRRVKDREDGEVVVEGKVSVAKAVLLKKLETLREEEKSACDSVEKSRSFFEEEWPTNKEKNRANGAGDVIESGKMSVKVLLHHPAPASSSPSPSPPSTTTVQVPPSSASETTTTQIKNGELKLTAKKTGWQAFKAAVMKQPTPPENKMAGDDKKDIVDGDSEVIVEPEGKVPLTSLKVKLEKSVPNNVSKTPHSLFDAQHPLKQMDFKPEEYLADLLVGVKQVLQARLEDIQNQFKSRLISLEEEVKRKDIIIKRLEEALHHGDTTADSGPHSATPPPPPIVTEDGNRSSLEDGCQVVSKSPSGDDDEDDYFEDEFEEASDVTHPGYVSHPRRSWPLLPPWSRGSERHSQRPWESQAALDIDPEQLWRVEFPAGESEDARARHWTLLPQQDLSDEEETHERTASQASDNVFDMEELQNVVEDRVGGSRNDWEIKMLAEELLKQDSRTESESSQGARGDARDDVKSDCKEKGCASERKRTLRVEEGRRMEEFVSHSPIKCAQDHVVLEEEDEEEDEDEDEDDDDGGDDQVPQTTEEENGGHGLLGVLQQLSPTERRELERLLEVATRRHLSRQMSLQVQQDHQPLPHQRSLGDQNGVQGNGVRRRMSADPSAWSLPLSLFPPAPSSSQSTSGGMDGSAEVVNGASHPVGVVTEQCYFEDENLRREIPTIALLSPPPGDEDTVSICIPECEPLLGPKQQ